MVVSKLTIEFTLTEARILAKAIAGHTPNKEDEMISFMLYSRIKRVIEDFSGKIESI